MFADIKIAIHSEIIIFIGKNLFIWPNEIRMMNVHPFLGLTNHARLTL
jgi:hypothetical protein